MSDLNDQENLDNTVDSILSQIKNTPTLLKKVNQVSKDEITKENLENFVIQYASRLIENATESVEYIKDNVQAAPTADDVISLAELIKSTSGALEVLNKIVNTNKKSDTSIKIKQMDVESKREELDTKVGLALTASREEIMKQLMNNSKVIEIEND